MGDRLFSESPEGRVLREIWKRDPAFDMNAFLAGIRIEATEVVRAYLRSDSEVLSRHCTPEVTKKLLAVANAIRQQGRIPDDRILHVGHAQTRMIKAVEGNPVLVVLIDM